MSRTIPRKSSRTMMSPMLYFPSKMMNRPVITSSIRLCAPKPSTSPMIPTPASTAVESTPSMLSPQMTPKMTARYLAAPVIIAVTVPACAFRLPIAPRISLTSWYTSHSTQIARMSVNTCASVMRPLRSIRKCVFSSSARFSFVAAGSGSQAGFNRSIVRITAITAPTIDLELFFFFFFILILLMASIR